MSKIDKKYVDACIEDGCFGEESTTTLLAILEDLLREAKGYKESNIDERVGICGNIVSRDTLRKTWFGVVLRYASVCFGYKSMFYPLPRGATAKEARGYYLDGRETNTLWKGEQLEWRIRFLEELIEFSEAVLEELKVRG